MASSRCHLVHVFLLLSFCCIVSAETSVWDLEFAGAKENSSCSLEISPDSLNRLAEAVKLNFLWIHLKINAQNVTKSNEWSQLLSPSVVTWADDVTYPLLKYPFDFDMLSLGILNSVTDNIKIDLNTSTSDCTIELGGYTAFFQIYQAFHKATRKMKHAKHGVVCFPVKFEVTRADQFFGIQRESAGYLCCDTSIGTKGSSKSTRNICYVIKQAWLLNLSMICGFVAFCFFPFYIKYIAAGKSPLNLPTPEPGKAGYESLDDPFQDGEKMAWEQKRDRGTDSDEWVELNGNHGMGLLSLFKSILCFNISSKITSRFRRLLFVVLSPSILYIRIALEYSYKRDILQAFIDKGVPLGYLAIPFGFEKSRINWGYIMGGPYILFLIYYISACFLVCLPDNLGEVFCAKAVTKRRGWTFLALGIGFLEEYGLHDRKSRILGRTGFDKLHAIMMAQFYMLFNGKFWALLFRTWFARGLFVVQLLSVRSKRTLGCYAVSSLLLPVSVLVLAVLMLLEGLLVGFYYGLPVLFLFISGLHRVIHLYACKLTTFSRSAKTIRGLCLSLVLSFMAAIGFGFVYLSACFTFSYFFIHSLITIFQVIAFTFVGILVNPSRALVYVIAGSTILLYLADSVFGFSRAYSDLSRQTILTVEKISKETKNLTLKDGILHVEDARLDDSSNIKKVIINGRVQHDVTASRPVKAHFAEGRPFARMLRYKDGIPMVPRKLFLFVSERHLPIRREVLTSVVKVILIACFLELSAYVISHFGKKSDLPIGFQAVATLLTGLLPKLIQFFRTSLVLSKSEEDLQRRLPFTIEEFIEQDESSTLQEDMPSVSPEKIEMVQQAL